MAMGYWGPDITGELLRSQRWAGPDKLIGGVFDVIAAYKLDAAKRKQRKARAAMDEELEAEMAVQGGPVFGKKQGGSSLFEDMDRPEYSRTPATQIMRDMHFGAQLGWEREEGERAGKLSDATALLREKARLDEEQEKRQMARMREIMAEGMGPEAATTQAPAPRLEAPAYPALPELPEREVAQGLYPESVRPGMSQSIFDVLGQRAAAGLPMTGGAPRAMERNFSPEPGGTGAVFRPPPTPPMADAFRGAGPSGGVLPAEAARSGVVPAAQPSAAAPAGAPGGGYQAPDLNQLLRTRDRFNRAAIAFGSAGQTSAQLNMARNASLVDQQIESYRKQQLEDAKKGAVWDLIEMVKSNLPTDEIFTQLNEKWPQLPASEMRANMTMLSRLQDQRLNIAERANQALSLVERIKPTKEGFMRMRIHTPDMEREWIVSNAMKIAGNLGMTEVVDFLGKMLPEVPPETSTKRAPDMTTKSGVKVWKQQPAP